MPRTKIVCTIGPASREPDMLRQLIQAGMDVARLNFSHGDRATHGENIERVRAAATRAGRTVAILADLQGPKLRVGEMAKQGVPLREGEEVLLTTEQVIGRDSSGLPVQYRGFPGLVQPGDRILLDDGLIELQVRSHTDSTVRCVVSVGGILQSNKGINLPRVSLGLPSLTDKDREDLAFALAHGVDWVALSFVRAAEEVLKLKDLIAELVSPGVYIPVMAKIEKPEALQNLDQIIATCDAVMVARGDLGIEIRAEEVPMAQKRIIEACNRAGVPVATATQMLDSMIRHPRPTRAEASDVANAILDGTDAIMLSGETSIGSYPLQAVQTMVRIAAQVEAVRDEVYRCPLPQSGRRTPLTIADAVTHAARETALDLQAAAIITPTASGYTARLVSSHRPRSPIVAVTPDPAVQRQLALYWGVTPLLARRTDNTDEMIADAVEAARGSGWVKEGDTVVITAGAAGSPKGTTNLIKVQSIAQQPEQRSTRT
jgi:pyruvate kinase